MDLWYKVEQNANVKCQGSLLELSKAEGARVVIFEHDR